MAVTKLQISPAIVNGFENGFHQWIQRIFLVVVVAKKVVFRNFCLNLDPLCGPLAAKPLVLELLCLEVGTSVTSAVTAETRYESMKCMCGVDMRGRVRMGSKSQIFMFFNSGYAHDRNISIFRRRAWRRRALKPLELRSSKNARRRVFWHTTTPVNLV